jgi:hypothetical protein
MQLARLEDAAEVMDTEFGCPALNAQLRATRWAGQDATFVLDGVYTVRASVRVPEDDVAAGHADPRACLAFVRDAARTVYALGHSRPPRELRIRLRLLDAPKRACGSGGTLTACEINSGWTEWRAHEDRRKGQGRGRGQGRSCAIEIYRREDWAKVLLHELLHACEWDRLAPGRMPANSPASPLYESEPASEALVEAVAQWLYTAMLAAGDAADSDADTLAARWKRAQRFAQKCARLPGLGSRTQSVAATTNVRAYYLLKAGLMGTRAAWRETLAWLSTRDPARTWPRHAARAMERALRIRRSGLGAATGPGSASGSASWSASGQCTSTRMVECQLSLRPAAVPANEPANK